MQKIGFLGLGKMGRHHVRCAGLARDVQLVAAGDVDGGRAEQLPADVPFTTDLDELIEGKVVEFEFDSAVLTDEGKALLDEIVAALKQVPLVPVEIAGHTDDVGSPESNLVLSRERAEAVLSYLLAAGEDADRFVVIGYGESQPIADNATEEGRARNRRIQFVALLEEN